MKTQIKKMPSKVSKPKSKTSKSAAASDILEMLKGIATQLFSSEPKDITDAIKTDHESLRNFMGLLKDTAADMNARREAYSQFASLLKSHTTSEEDVVYSTSLDLPGREMHIKLAEGFVEHHLAEDLMARIEITKKPLDWSAHANVLSEIVEHHLKEEERDLLPLIKKTAPMEMNQKMLKRYLSLRAKTQGQVTKKNAGVLKK